MARVRVVMMQKDEGDYLARWLGHYGGLFGYRNLDIMDNGSQDALTVSLLRAAEAAGSRIYWGYDTPHDFQNKAAHFRNIIRSWDSESDYDFALPLDCDEILSVYTTHGMTTDHGAIHTEFDRLIGTQEALRIDISLFNTPGREGWFAPDPFFYKGFVPSKALESLDNGLHMPMSRLAPGIRETRFAYLHFHNRDFADLQARARAKLQGRVNLDDDAALRAYMVRPGAPGAHLVPKLLMSEADYLSSYDDKLQICVPAAGDSTLILTQAGTFVWNAAAYLAANPDVAADSLGPLHHYLRWGYEEGRRLAP